MKIGILQTGHAPEQLLQTTGDYDVLFERLLAGNGFNFSTYNVVDMEFPKDISTCDGWLITGSRHGVYEDHAFIPPLETFIRDVYAADIPLVGICFGHQIIAQALGGTVVKFAEGWAVGRQTYAWEGEEMALNAWHQDQVVVLPKDATVIASNAFCTNAALIYGKRVFSTQPHPEFGIEYMSSLVTFRGKGVVPDDLLAKATDSLEEPVDNARIADQIARFFKERVVV
ncbi:type 1 glutamine amidotransferase [Roseobacter sp. CCS2]|uniref:type 1 glutamine amidotransferase n=1 Tax=Roseobacter sp. CCS2 TaxID=391593 RepID=UPI0000F3E073|nr:type 1 glutamine amidotransferase [Roseobacter sp. CCS2]EBA12712.1 glutamine amidotransferase, class I [Roseobacter sp. CCS2]